MEFIKRHDPRIMRGNLAQESSSYQIKGNLPWSLAGITVGNSTPEDPLMTNLRCTYCNHVSSDPVTMGKHQFIDHVAKVCRMMKTIYNTDDSWIFLRCLFCEFASHNADIVRRHQKEKHAGASLDYSQKSADFAVFNCEVCDFFSMESITLWHHRKCHDIVGSIPRCHLCTFGSWDHNTLRGHKRADHHLPSTNCRCRRCCKPAKTPVPTKRKQEEGNLDDDAGPSEKRTMEKEPVPSPQNQPGNSLPAVKPIPTPTAGTTLTPAIPAVDQPTTKPAVKGPSFDRSQLLQLELEIRKGFQKIEEAHPKYIQNFKDFHRKIKELEDAEREAYARKIELAARKEVLQRQSLDLTRRKLRAEIELKTLEFQDLDHKLADRPIKVPESEKAEFAQKHSLALAELVKLEEEVQNLKREEESVEQGLIQAEERITMSIRTVPAIRKEVENLRERLIRLHDIQHRRITDCNQLEELLVRKNQKDRLETLKRLVDVTAEPVLLAELTSGSVP